jgi:hypothetical protein
MRYAIASRRRRSGAGTSTDNRAAELPMTSSRCFSAPIKSGSHSTVESVVEPVLLTVTTRQHRNEPNQ